MAHGPNPFDTLSDRQRVILRYVARAYSSADIHRETGWSPDAIDKQCKLACAKLGCEGDRRRAARLLEAHEAGVHQSDPPIAGPSERPFFPLPLPLPTAERPTNDMDWRQVLAWGVIIAIISLAAISLAAESLSSLGRLGAGITSMGADRNDGQDYLAQPARRR